MNAELGNAGAQVRRSPAEAREAHSIMSAVKDAVVIWYALLGGLAAWIIHLLAFVSLARESATHAGTRWAMHGITAGTLVMTIVAMALSARLARPPGDTAGRDDRGRDRFIGHMGLLIGGINFALICLEELYLNIIRRGSVG